MKRSALLLSALALTLLLTGCNPAMSVRPIYTSDDKLVTDPRIEGEWISLKLNDDQPEPRLKFTLKGDHYEVELRQPLKEESSDSQKVHDRDSDHVNHYAVSLVNLQQATFADVEPSEHKAAANEDIIEHGVISPHMLGRIWIAPDFLRVAMAGSDWLKSKGSDDFRYMSGHDAIITAATADLRKFLVQHQDDEGVFSQPIYMCRPTVDCPLRAVEDWIARKPDDSDAIEGAIGVYFERHKYDKMVTLSRHMTEVKPQDAEARMNLALALEYVHDFKGARAELEAASKLSEDKNKARMLRDQIGWTYFLEGDYAQTVKTFSGAADTADAILLHYYSLLRLGRRKQAEALLAKEAAGFSGSLREQALLLQAQGRVGDAFMAFNGHDESTYRYFLALASIDRGEKEMPARYLQEALKAGDEKTALAPTIELERLEKAK